MISLPIDELEWLNWFRGAAACGRRYRIATTGFPHAQLGPMIIRGTSTMVAGEGGLVMVSDQRAEFVIPEAANEN